MHIILTDVYTCGACCRGKTLWRTVLLPRFPPILPIVTGRYTYVIPLVSQFLAPSQHMHNAAVMRGVPVHRIEVLRYNSPAPANSAICRRPGAIRTARPMHIGYIGTLSPHKGVHILLCGFRRAKLKHAKLTICGPSQDRDYPEYSKLLRKMARGLPVEFRGCVPHGRVYETLATFDLLAVPSLWLEVAPLVISESRAVGVPVIASNHGALAEMVKDEISGFLFRPGDADDLSKKLQRIYETPALIDLFAGKTEPSITFEEHVRQYGANLSTTIQYINVLTAGYPI